ncbi:hypothetical protein D9M71_785100 [compost metagenome]
MPHEPGRCLPEGVKVPPVQVSVMPQPSVSWQPLRRLNWWISSTGKGAPPDAQTLSERRSYSPTCGWLTRAVNMVGTPGKQLTLCWLMSCRMAVGSNLIRRRISAAARTGNSRSQTMA